jgi:hypothetical protein
MSPVTKNCCFTAKPSFHSYGTSITVPLLDTFCVPIVSIDVEYFQKTLRVNI